MLKHVGDGFIVANGQAVRKAAMECGKVQLQLRNMKEHGLVAYKMATDLKLMLMEVILPIMFRNYTYYSNSFAFVRLRCLSQVRVDSIQMNLQFMHLKDVLKKGSLL